jgi:hypothetical protein
MPTPAAPSVTLIIPCGKDKASEPKPAKKLYTGRMYLHTLATVLAVAAWCEQRGIPVRIFILSALHGLIGLDEEIAPYDLKMGDDGSVTPAVLADQARQLGLAPGEVVCAFLPRAYLARLTKALGAVGLTARDMYEGTGGIGDQRHVNAVVTRQPGSCFDSEMFPGSASPAPQDGGQATDLQLW